MNIKFPIAGVFGNVHGVYKPSNEKLSPERSGKYHAYVKPQNRLKFEDTILFVLWRESGSEKSDIHESTISSVIEMNIDTDTQRAYRNGILQLYKCNKGNVQGQ